MSGDVRAPGRASPLDVTAEWLRSQLGEVRLHRIGDARALLW
jgi:hypothetical protein